MALVKIAGSQTISGGNGLASGQVNSFTDKEDIRKRILDGGFLHTPASILEMTIDPSSMDRQLYCDMFGPTTGDLLRLGLTDLWIKIEKDFTTYGDECTFGGGKTLREGMGQATGVADADCLDSVIINAVIVDWTGIFKGDIGIKNGKIAGIGKAGNPSVMEGVDTNLIVGACTDVIAGENSIITAGGFDSHVHFVCPQQVYESISSGITTMLGGGTGPRYLLHARFSYVI